MSQFSKVTVDSASRKRSPFPLGGKVSTSFQFGEVAPIHCRYLTPNSSSSVNVRSLVRLDPMVAPTSQGIIKCKQWHSFVGMSDLFRHWSAFQTGKSIAGSNGIITFNKLPHMRMCDLALLRLLVRRLRLTYLVMMMVLLLVLGFILLMLMNLLLITIRFVVGMELL